MKNLPLFVYSDAQIFPWPDVWTPEQIFCVSSGKHLAPLDVVLPNNLLVRVMHPFVVTDYPGFYEIFCYTTVHASEQGIGRGLVTFAKLKDPTPSHPTCQQDIINGLARAFDAAIGQKARQTRLLLQTFLKNHCSFPLTETDNLYLRFPTSSEQGRIRLCHTQGSSNLPKRFPLGHAGGFLPPSSSSKTIIVKRLPPPLLSRVACLRAPNPHGGLSPPEFLPWIDPISAHTNLALQGELEQLLSQEQ